MKCHSLLLAATGAATLHLLGVDTALARQPSATPQATAELGARRAALPVERQVPALDGATQWLNSTPLSRETLRGKVVLVNFWTYTCINWLRSLPHVRAWAETYKDRGLVVIGVHSPEFSFERNVDNVRWAVRDRGIAYPVAIDSDLHLWHAFDNAYWPAIYVIDAQGRIRHHRFGEGHYEETRDVIERLLVEAGHGNVQNLSDASSARGAEVEADWSQLESPETYLGFARTVGFDSPGGARLEERHGYTVPASLRRNHWALSGVWNMGKEAVVLNQAPGRIAYRFHARDLHLVMGPVTGTRVVRFRVLIDGRPPGEAHGTDVDAQGNGTVIEQRLYQLIRQPESVVDRQFEIEFLDPGVAAFSVTFG